MTLSSSFGQPHNRKQEDTQHEQGLLYCQRRLKQQQCRIWTAFPLLGLLPQGESHVAQVWCSCSCGYLCKKRWSLLDF